MDVFRRAAIYINTEHCVFSLREGKRHFRATGNLLFRFRINLTNCHGLTMRTNSKLDGIAGNIPVFVYRDTCNALPDELRARIIFSDFQSLRLYLSYVNPDINRSGTAVITIRRNQRETRERGILSSI